MNILIFYGGKLYESLSIEDYARIKWSTYLSKLDAEVRNGCYIYRGFTTTLNPVQWYRGDLTPVLLEDVPLELRGLVLLYT
jgi:hypothetical protein